MFFDEEFAIKKCEEEPSQIFNLIDEGHIHIVEAIYRKRWSDVNLTNEKGQDVVSYLLLKGYNDLALKLMNRESWDVNHQDKEGNTFAHIVVTKNYLDVIDIIKSLSKNKSFLPNIVNKKGETILDISMSNDDYIYTTVKILEDERFNNIDLISFKNLYEKYIRNDNYGVYSKMNNLEVIVDNLKEKDLLPKVNKALNSIIKNIDEIKDLVMNNDIKQLDNIVYSFINR